MAEIKGTYIAGTATIDANSYVGFKMGYESKLKDASFKATGGVFYLTSDTHRLFIGNSDGSVSPVNQGVIPVDSLPDKTGVIPGQFYYITGSNILATFNGTQWVQINPDTQVTAADLAVGAGGTNEATVQLNITQEGGTHTNVSVVSDKVKIKGANDIVVTVDTATDTITLTDADYSFSTSGTENDVKFNLVRDPADGDAAVESTVTLKGVDGVDVTQSGNVITVSAADAMNAASNASIASAGFSNHDTSGFDLTLTRVGGESFKANAHLDPVVRYGKTNVDAKFESGIASLNVYTISEIDEKMKNALRDFNALTYKGTVGSGSAKVSTLPTSGVQNGDVYMSNGSFTFSGVQTAAGTLFIATGTEGTDGYLTTIEWTQVENYNTDTITSVDTSADNTISFSNSILDGTTPGENTFLGSFKVTTKSGDPLGTTTSVVDKKREVVINHTKSGYAHTEADASQAADENVLFTTNKLLGAIGVDDWGHVQSSSDVMIEVPTEKFSAAKYDAALGVTGTAGNLMTGAFATTVTLEKSIGGTVSTTVLNSKIASETLVLTDSSDTLKMDLVWGSF